MCVVRFGDAQRVHTGTFRINIRGRTLNRPSRLLPRPDSSPRVLILKQLITELPSTIDDPTVLLLDPVKQGDGIRMGRRRKHESANAGVDNHAHQSPL